MSHKRPALERDREREGGGSDHHYSQDDEGGRGHGGHEGSRGGGDSGPPLTFIRAIISTKMVGAVIGRGGSTVRNIREETGTRITISEPVPGSNERILTASGNLEGVAKAYGLIHGKIEEANLVLNLFLFLFSFSLSLAH